MDIDLKTKDGQNKFIEESLSDLLEGIKLLWSNING